MGLGLGLETREHCGPLPPSKARVGVGVGVRVRDEGALRPAAGGVDHRRAHPLRLLGGAVGGDQALHAREQRPALGRLVRVRVGVGVRARVRARVTARVKD